MRELEMNKRHTVVHMAWIQAMCLVFSGQSYLRNMVCVEVVGPICSAFASYFKIR